MDEGEWLACADPQKMLEFLRGKVSDRKLRLFASACARRLWRLLTEEESRRAVEVAERFTDGRASADHLAEAEESADEATIAVYGTAEADVSAAFYAADAASWAATGDPEKAATFAVQAVSDACLRERYRVVERAAQAALLRDVLGNPFRPAAISPAWQTPTVVALAQAASDERELPAGTLDTTRLAVLADALEEAGCTDPDLLIHLREKGPYVRGCWVVDLLLGKE